MTRTPMLVALVVTVVACSDGGAPTGDDATVTRVDAPDRADPLAGGTADDPDADPGLAALRARLGVLQREHDRLLEEFAAVNVRLGRAEAFLDAAGFGDEQRRAAALDAIARARDAVGDVDPHVLLRMVDEDARDVGVAGRVHGTWYPAAWLAPDER